MKNVFDEETANLLGYQKSYPTLLEGLLLFAGIPLFVALILVLAILLTK